jgi:hypothetical protein
VNSVALELQEAIIDAVMALSMIPFAPQKPDQHEQLMIALAAFADKPDALKWTVGIAVANWHQWLGIAELRGIYCSRFKPADGIEADAMETPGFTPGDNETAYLMDRAADTDQQIEQWKREAKLLPAEDQKANQELLDQVQRMKKVN